MEALKDYKRHLIALGISESTGKLGTITWTFIALQTAIIVNLIVYVIFKWKDIDDRFVALKALPVWMITFGFTLSLVVFLDDFSPMVAATLERFHFEIPYQMTSRRMEIIRHVQPFAKTINKLWRLLLKNYIALAFVFPMTLVTLNICLFSGTFQTAIQENYASPFPVYFPEYFGNFIDAEYLLNAVWYLMFYTIQASYLFISFSFCHLSYAVPICSMLNVEVEFKLMTLSLMEMGDLLRQPVLANNVDAGKGISDDSLKNFLKYFVRHHQNTYRKFDAITNGIKWIAFTVCTTATLYICLSMYTIVQADQILKKVYEAGLLVTWVNSLFQFCFFGERLKTEVENCRNALYECAWTDKPQWFKKSLLIIMARTGRPVDIKPFGFYGFDLNRFATAINAVYCYYNMLCNFKSNDL